VPQNLEKNYFTGQLSDFLMKFEAGQKNVFTDWDTRLTFDVAFVDLCGHLSQENKLALKTLFEHRLMNAASIFAVTLCFRDRDGLEYYHESTFGGIIEIQMIALAAGYYLGDITAIQNKKVCTQSHNMYVTNNLIGTYVCKCIEVKNVLSNELGFKPDDDNLCADDWVLRPVKIPDSPRRKTPPVDVSHFFDGGYHTPVVSSIEPIVKNKRAAE
jgi:hypothetical protein